MRDRRALVGSVAAGILASACCIGPLLLGALGIGSAGVASAFAPWRPLLLGLTALFLTFGFYLAYRPRRDAQCAPSETCAVPASRRSRRITLWMVTVLTVALATYPSWAARIVRPGAGAASASTAAMVRLDVQGMTCESCAREIEQGLREVPGVVTAAVEYPSGRAEIGLDRSGADPAPLLAAVRQAGYRASVARGVPEPGTRR